MLVSDDIDRLKTGYVIALIFCVQFFNSVKHFFSPLHLTLLWLKPHL